MKNFLKGPGFIILLVALVLVLALSFSDMTAKRVDEFNYTELLEQIKEGKVAKLKTIEGSVQVYGWYKPADGSKVSSKAKNDFVASIPGDAIFYNDVSVIMAEKLGKDIEKISANDFEFEYIPTDPQGIPWWISLIPMIVLVAFIVITIIIFKRQAGDPGKGAMSFSKSRAVRYDASHKKVTFADVAGAEEEKQELVEIVEFLKDRQKFEALGARIPKGVLLVGEPGTGKTYLAKAVAGEAGVPFLSISGSDFVEMYVGVGASRVRDLFNQAKRLLPCIIFIDEIDAVGRQRGTGLGGGHDEREQTLNQLLVEMDGFNVNSGLVVMAATNRADILDPALTRPGRFDRQIYVTVPDVAAREKIFRIHSRNKPLASDIDMNTLARLTPGYTPADIENIMNEAAILAARVGKKAITMEEITEAIKRVSIGPEKKSRKVPERDRENTAYHEAGHAIVSTFLKKADPVEEISIIPRGRAGGYTSYLPPDDRTWETYQSLSDRITYGMGGRAAEKLIFEDVSTGASADIVQATNIARAMVTEFGMSDELGPISYSENEHQVFIGRSIGSSRSYSEETATKIDAEIKKLINSGYEEALKILTDNIDKLHKVAKVLLEKEKITGAEFRKLISDEPEEAKAEETKTEDVETPSEEKTEE